MPKQQGGLSWLKSHERRTARWLVLQLDWLTFSRKVRHGDTCHSGKDDIGKTGRSANLSRFLACVVGMAMRSVVDVKGRALFESYLYL